MDAMEQRRNRIEQFINDRSSITFAELKEEFSDVSDMTLRTDLRALDEEKRIIRVHGGAKAVEAVLGNDDQLMLREVRNVAQKEACVEKALTLIKPNTTIFLDSGSTTTMLARRLPDQPMMIFTCSLTVAMELAKLEQPRVFFQGGALNRNSLSMYGQLTADLVRQVRFDQAFMGVTSCDADGFTCGHPEESTLKRAVISSADQNIMLVDSSKFGRRSTFSFCALKEADVVVSDDVPAEFLTVLEEAGITVL